MSASAPKKCCEEDVGVDKWDLLFQHGGPDVVVPACCEISDFLFSAVTSMSEALISSSIRTRLGWMPTTHDLVKHPEASASSRTDERRLATITCRGLRVTADR